MVNFYESEDKKESKWNMEEARHRSVDFFLKNCELNLINWNLDEAYWSLREIKIMVIPKFSDTEKEDVNNKLTELETFRGTWLKNKVKDGEFRLELENFYELLNNLMVQHDMYFREKEAILGL